MAGLVSNRHLIQAIHRPASETLTPMTGVGTCDGTGKVTSPHPWLLTIGVPGYPIRTKRPDLGAGSYHAGRGRQPLPGGRGCWLAISPESGSSRSPWWPVASGAFDYPAS